MAKVLLKSVRKSYPGSGEVVKDFNLEVQDKEFVVLLGPSGCGKTTTLRMVAGLEEISSGEIWIDDRKVNDVPPKDRDIAMVFQNYALYPHMTVYENMAFGLKLRKYPKNEIDQRVREAADILGLNDLLTRKPKALSGGERQRVALGRAIVRKPKVFLFDEPLSNLDAKLRVQTRAEISKLHHRLQATILYVTHDQIEAMTMGDRIVVMNKGRVQQIAPPLRLYNEPTNRFVAGFIGTPPMNLIEGELLSRKGGVYFSTGEGIQVRAIDDQAERLTPHVGKTVQLGLRPEHIHDKLYAPNASPDNTVTARVEVVQPLGPITELYVTVGRTPLIAQVRASDAVEVNQDMDLVFEMSKAHVFDLETEQSIV
ncbi:MAG: sn-glycerol-3-phosphate ABC transporter ATP-binding protein UgpC [bacterium]